MEKEEEYIAKKYNISDKNIVRKWVKAYNALGEKGLLRSGKKEDYYFDFKLHVVGLYLTTEVSYQEIVLSVGINNPSLITKWANDYLAVSSDALKPKRSTNIIDFIFVVNKCLTVISILKQNILYNEFSS